MEQEVNNLKETRNILIGSPLAAVLISIFIFWGKHAQANGEQWKALILAITTNIIVFICLFGFAMFWRAVRRYERQIKKEKQIS